MRRFKTGNKVLSHEELTKEKKAPVINNLEAFAFWKCNLLITDHERKMGKQKEREVVTDKAEELERVNGGNRYFEPKKIDGKLLFENEEDIKQDENLPFNDGDNKQQLIEECIKRKLQQFGKEVSADGAEAIGMQLDNIPIKEIAKWQKRKVGTQREFIRVSKEKARSSLNLAIKLKLNLKLRKHVLAKKELEKKQWYFRKYIQELPEAMQLNARLARAAFEENENKIEKELLIKDQRFFKNTKKR